MRSAERFLAQLVERPQRAKSSQVRHWAALLPDIPRTILDLINSKACRGQSHLSHSVLG